MDRIIIDGGDKRYIKTIVNKGIGKKFLLNIFNNHYKNQYISVETNTNKALNFYLNHIHFKEIGFRKRSKTNLYLMLKKIS